MSVHKIFRERFRAIAKERGRGIYKQIAYKSGYADGYIRGLANSVRNPTIGAVWAIAEALEVDPLWLLGSDSNKESVSVEG